MARRSATNERYQKFTGPAGKTRKSAAAAKPKRASSSSGSKKSSKPSASAKRGPLIMNPPTAEYRRWRRIWWILLIVALVLTGGSWLVRVNIPSLTTLSGAALGVGYASIFAALYIDWTKLRRLRLEWEAKGRPSAEQETGEEKS